MIRVRRFAFEQAGTTGTRVVGGRVIINWFLHTFGIDDGSGAWYLFWSGIVGDLALLGGLFVLARRVNCHAKGCWRIGIHHVVGTPYVTCRRHHPVVPNGKVTAEHIAQVHQGAVSSGLAMPDHHYTGDVPV